MKQTIQKLTQTTGVLMVLMFGMSQPAQAVIEGITGPTFNLTAAPGYISTADGGSVFTWGFANADVSPVTMQYPGPTLIVNQGDTVTVNLSNELPLPVSMIFPGQSNVSVSMDLQSQPGVVTREASVGGRVSYSFVADKPGTYMYQSATMQAMQVEMGLAGTLIVRPSGTADPLHHAYTHADTHFDFEYLFLLSEMDPAIHAQVEKASLPGGILFQLKALALQELLLQQQNQDAMSLVLAKVAQWSATLVDVNLTPEQRAILSNQMLVELSQLVNQQLVLSAELTAVAEQVLALNQRVLAGEVADLSSPNPTLWFINGRNGPDTLLDSNVSWLPNQPYNIVPRMHPGTKLLLRVVSVGRDMHPFHTHGNNTWLIARDGRMLESAPGMGPDLASSNYTIQTAPGQTYDATFEWTGKGLNWDIYGHAPGDAMEANEYAPDHGKPFPQVSAGVPLSLPNVLDLAEGQFYSGSPFLGSSVAARPGQVDNNQFGGYFHMWHSHNEKELTNDNVFPGGMMTLVVIEPNGVDIPQATY